MSSHLWDVEKHIIPASHIRGAPRSVRNEDAPYVKLAVNQYTPKANAATTPQEGALTIILLHGIGSSKETFEPFLDDLLTSPTTPPIRSVWLPDSAFTGESYTLNASNLGDVVHWHDYARDVLHMANNFQSQMPPPLIGMAYSYGCGVLTLASAFHPRLFSGLIFLESSIGPKPGQINGWRMHAKLFPGIAATRRKHTFTSRAHTRAAFLKTPYYKSFDPRVLDKVLAHELRPVTDAERANLANPDLRAAPDAVTLTTPRHIEAYQWLLADPPLQGHPATLEHSLPREHTASRHGFFSPFAVGMVRNLQFLVAPVLLVWARKSPLNPIWDRDFMLQRIGAGEGGSGGVAAGMVEEVWVEDATHPLAFEKPAETARAVVPWLVKLKGQLDEQREARKMEPPFLDDFPMEWKRRVAKI